MSFPRKSRVTVTVNSSGDATAYLGVENSVNAGIYGKIIRVSHYPDATNPFTDDAVGFTITLEGSGETVWTQSNVSTGENQHRYPSVAIHDNVGVALSSGATDYIRASNDRLKIVVAQGGNAKLGVFEVVWE